MIRSTWDEIKNAPNLNWAINRPDDYKAQSFSDLMDVGADYLKAGGLTGMFAKGLMAYMDKDEPAPEKFNPLYADPNNPYGASSFGGQSSGGFFGIGANQYGGYSPYSSGYGMGDDGGWFGSGLFGQPVGQPTNLYDDMSVWNPDGSYTYGNVTNYGDYYGGTDDADASAMNDWGDGGDYGGFGGFGGDDSDDGETD